MNATRFEIDDSPRETQPHAPSGAAGGARAAARWLGRVEWLLLVPAQVYAAVGWLAIPVLLVLAAPLVVFALFFAVQAPVFLIMWKLFGGDELAADSESTPT